MYRSSLSSRSTFQECSEARASASSASPATARLAGQSAGSDATECRSGAVLGERRCLRSAAASPTPSPRSSGSSISSCGREKIGSPAAICRAA